MSRSGAILNSLYRGCRLFLYRELSLLLRVEESFTFRVDWQTPFVPVTRYRLEDRFVVAHDGVQVRELTSKYYVASQKKICDGCPTANMSTQVLLTRYRRLLMQQKLKNSVTVLLDYNGKRVMYTFPDLTV